MPDHERALQRILLGDNGFRTILETVRDCDPPDWFVGAGVIRSLVWDRLHAFNRPTPLRDVDVAFFDPHDLSPEWDRRVRDQLAARLPGVPWEATNQAAVHLWYEQVFGCPVAPLQSSAEAIATRPWSAGPSTSMNVRSLGYHTDLIFPAFDGEVIDRGDYLVVRTPTNPFFYWGHFLLFAQPPGEGDFDRWRELFHREIGAPPATEHQVFGWDSPEGEQGAIRPFLQAGFHFIRDVVLTASEPRRPARPSDLVSVRALKTGADWEQAFENQVVCREPEFGEDEYRAFKRPQMERYRKMAAAGRGDWFGAFLDGRLVADLGIFHDEGLGRFQSVETHPEFRRRGIAGTLIYAAGRQAVAAYGLHTLVIVAEQASAPARLYRSLGFRPTEEKLGLEWWPQIRSRENSSD